MRLLLVLGIVYLLWCSPGWVLVLLAQLVVQSLLRYKVSNYKSSIFRYKKSLKALSEPLPQVVGLQPFNQWECLVCQQL